MENLVRQYFYLEEQIDNIGYHLSFYNNMGESKYSEEIVVANRDLEKKKSELNEVVKLLEEENEKAGNIRVNLIKVIQGFIRSI
ncbi:hypothetical protein [Mucilaginibacter psychrotolerans]|uniref:Uncharacterized protein n=1 Tax=Mucilaginibacter psychrotolerans TaxID=1524096 RepID=A0A4Y8S590_9SPHI|nr:hypothetical protein [Mucilaginibacter psychrotolerans]TFF33906.1 hypothetical protein E2R66_23805 [Mucilaginibacter psychrotolerans]